MTKNCLFLWALLLAAAVPALAAPHTYLIAIGLDRVNWRAPVYSGWDGALSSCERDVTFLTGLFPAGDTVTPLPPLLNENATHEAVCGAIREVAAKAVKGDRVVISFSGHGVQLPDANGDERTNHPGDNQDEAWCLYDDILIDDELYDLWAGFDTGVGIVVIANCCHAGTSVKDPGKGLSTWSRKLMVEWIRRRQLNPLREFAPERRGGGTLSSVVPKAAPVASPGLILLPPWRLPAALPGSPAGAGKISVMSMPPSYHALLTSKMRAELATRQKQTTAEAAPLRASVFVFAACDDDQEAIAIEDSMTLYFLALQTVWQRGPFTGSCEDLAAAVKDAIDPEYISQHTPRTYHLGNDWQALAEKGRPFEPGDK
jgi:hypothetical protein